MAVPLIDKGVVVVAVDYDTAPKGRVSSFPIRCCFSCRVNPKKDEECLMKMSWECQPSACVSFQATWT